MRTTGILVLLSCVYTIAGCREKIEEIETVENEPVKAVEISDTEKCMIEVGSDSVTFEQLTPEKQDQVRRCVQTALTDQGRLKQPTEIPVVVTENKVNSEDQWIKTHEVSICLAGVSLANRWGDPGQAKPGTYIGISNGEHIFKEYDGPLRARCVIAAKRIMLGWHTRPFDEYKFGDIYYTFKKSETGVRVTEHAYGEIEHRDFEIK